MTHQLILEFADEATVNYVLKVCKRRGTTVENYILDNIEWDDSLQCFDENGNELVPSSLVCDDCEYQCVCTDRVVEA